MKLSKTRVEVADAIDMRAQSTPQLSQPSVPPIGFRSFALASSWAILEGKITIDREAMSHERTGADPWKHPKG